MANLICDLHFWSLREDLAVRDTDFSSFKYYDKSHQKTILDKPYAQDKLSYAVGRGQTCFIDGKRPNRLRSNFREMEELLEEQAVVFSEWRSSTLFQVMFANGLIANIFLNTMGDVEKISFDKFLVGRLLEHVSQVYFSSKMLIVTYLVSKVTLITFGKAVHFNTKDQEPVHQGEKSSKPFENLSQFDPKVQILDILGPVGRRLNRQVVVSDDNSLVLFWWSTSGNEVFPWAPHLKEEDRANIMIFSFNQSQAELKRIGFTRTNTDPVAIRFVTESGKIGVHYLGQDITRRGEVHVESVHFGVVDGDRKLRRKSSKKLVHNSEIVSDIFVADHLVILGGADGTLLLMDIVQHKLECQTKCAFVPNFLKLHPDQGLFIAANDKGLIQCFDIALSPIRLNFAIDDVISGNILDVSGYFQTGVTLMDVLWCSRKKELTAKPCPMEAMALNYLSLRFQGGPFVLVRVSGGCLSSPCPGSLGPLQISADYLAHDQYQQALLLLNQLDWKTQGQTLIISITNVFHKILRMPVQFTPDKEALLEMCLGLFHAPTKPIPDEIVDEFSEQMHDLSRKFFHELLRHHRFTKAFRLAVDLNDYDLFMDIHHAANRLRQKRQREMSDTSSNVAMDDAGIDGLADLAQAALIKAKIVFYEGDDDADKGDEDSLTNEEESDSEESDVEEIMEQNQSRIGQLHVSSTPAAASSSFQPNPEMMEKSWIPDQPVSSPSHHELGIPIVAPGSGSFGANIMTPSFHLTSFNTRNYQLSSVPPNMSRTGISLPSPIQIFASANRDHDDDEDQDEDEEFSRRNENPMESLGIASEESSLVSFQPEISATFTKTTAAKRIPTTAFQTKSDPFMASRITAEEMMSQQHSEALPVAASAAANVAASLPKIISPDDNQEDIQVIHFGLV